jgi:hypothetical protein
MVGLKPHNATGGIVTPAISNQTLPVRMISSRSSADIFQHDATHGPPFTVMREMLSDAQSAINGGRSSTALDSSNEAGTMKSRPTIRSS